MKIQYQEDTKRFPDFASYADAVKEAMKAFDLEKKDRKYVIGKVLKFYYVDQDGDIISITSEGDLKEAQREYPDGRLKLILTETLD